MFPSIAIALRIFLSLRASVASGEQGLLPFNYGTYSNRSFGFATLNINCYLARKIDFSSIINAFSDKKARRAFVK
jgi:hypothetical protein